MALKASVYIGISLDGFIARKDGGLDFLDHDAGGEDYGYQAFFDSVDTLVMGRGTYDKVLTFGEWSYEDKPVIVLTRSLKDSAVPPHLQGRVEFSAAPPRELVKALEAAGVRHIYVDGGQVIQAFLREGLIQELTLSVIPVLIGEGIPLFGALSKDIRLRHLETTAFASGLVQSRYRVE
jgi:dihydrofolate reductase